MTARSRTKQPPISTFTIRHAETPLDAVGIVSYLLEQFFGEDPRFQIEQDWKECIGSVKILAKGKPLFRGMIMVKGTEILTSGTVHIANESKKLLLIDAIKTSAQNAFATAVI